MASKHRAICDLAISVAEAYGPNVSKGSQTEGIGFINDLIRF